MVQNIIIAILAADVVVLMLIFRLYRVKARAGKKLQHQRDEMAGKNRVLEKAILEKEWLLREVHHRVKNNLHMISGLLGMQARRLKDDTARTAIMDSQHRVQAISMIHQKLSWDTDVSAVDFSSYLGDLMAHLKESYDTRPICFRVSVVPVVIDTRTALSLGLIINEAITNAIKHAFPQGRTGTVFVSLHNTADHFWTLVVQDDGVGIPPGRKCQGKSIGMTVMAGISEELEGDLHIDSTRGVRIEITFPYKESKIPLERISSPTVSSFTRDRMPMPSPVEPGVAF
jgi:two-component sensor histidine kinase